MHGAEEGGAQGWLLWNSKNEYDLGLEAIEEFVHSSAPPDSSRAKNRFPEPATQKVPGDPLGADFK